MNENDMLHDRTFEAHLEGGLHFKFDLTLERGTDGTHGLLDAAYQFLQVECRSGAAEVYDNDNRAWQLTPETRIIAVTIAPDSQ